MRPTYYIPKWSGSKCWLIRYVLKFLGDLRPKTVIEPFAGSAVIGLTLLSRGCTKRLVLAERDDRLRKFFTVALSDPEFAPRVNEWTNALYSRAWQKRWPFVLESLKDFMNSDPAFWALLKTRTSFNGNLDGGHVVGSKSGIDWPRTLALSLKFLYERRFQIEVLRDGFDALRRKDSQDSYAFLDPTYTLLKESPGNKLYKEKVDYEVLLPLLNRWKGNWQLTSEACLEMVALLEKTFPGRVDIDWNLLEPNTGRADGESEEPELVVSKKSGRVVEARQACGRVGLARLREILNRKSSSAVATGAGLEWPPSTSISRSRE